MTRTRNVGEARRGLCIYLAAVMVASGVIEWRLYREGGPISEHRGLVFLLMWTPALASLVARLMMREGMRDVSFRPGGLDGLKGMLIAWFYPVAVGALAYGAAWWTGLAEFRPPPLSQAGLEQASSMTRFFVLLALTASAGTLGAMVFAAGEEIGWRGYMLTRLIDAGVPRPVLTGGLIWGLWHTPLILSGQYASGPHPILSACIFIVDVAVFSYFIAWLRLTTGSVWPAVVAHGAWNAIIQGAFDASTTGTSLWVGESGILIILVGLALVSQIVRGRWPARRTPGEPVFADLEASKI
ncbi:MAG TPA: CPBP family intramembrane glutamic endopeptidase [Patescibacteria group bacterium]|nr:CPBP family intramembrane glutamic endopeptidase [Patescibacteria group bacterium]